MLNLTRLGRRHAKYDPRRICIFIWLWRSLRDAIRPHNDDVPAEASPFLIYIAVVLVFLLAILEVDAHRGRLESLGPLGRRLLYSGYFFEPVMLVASTDLLASLDCLAFRLPLIPAERPTTDRQSSRPAACLRQVRFACLVMSTCLPFRRDRS